MKARTRPIALVLALAAAALIVKLLFFPSVKDDYFTPDDRNMQQLPFGLVIVRPTHYPFLKRYGIFYGDAPDQGNNDWRMMGRNVPFRMVMAAAYDTSPAHVILPADAPSGNFDFLVTVPTNQEQHLQELVRRKFGYVAQIQTQETAALLLKIANPSLPGLKVSPAKENPDIDWDNVKLYYQHLRLRAMINRLERFFPTPIADETGLTNFYDYSFAWDPKTIRDLRNQATSRAAVDHIVNGLGLELQPGTASLDMLVVKKAN